MSDALFDATSSPMSPITALPVNPDDERPPMCPACNKRLVILAMHRTRDEHGEQIRRQMWGCPRGHATAYRTHGVFSSITMLADLSG